QVGGDASYRGGGGVDSFLFQRTAGNQVRYLSDLTVLMLGGNDHLNYTGIYVGGLTTFNGGAGTDTIFDGGGNTFGTAPTIIGF
ncbi:MAG: hypothetical protein KDA68_19580, partial [Planctomycetaceae bacterium]|nr:hypothetical protein [Planctomycetaceae bacterium]